MTISRIIFTRHPQAGSEDSRARRSLAIGVTLLAVTVGAVVTAAAAVTGAGVCSAPALDPNIQAAHPDSVCFSLVRTLAERVGIAAAATTVIIVLTMVGLSRLAVGPEGSSD